MTSSRDLRSLVTEAVTCSICLELFKNPKSLPCLHTFCLKCIEGHCRDYKPGVEVACPVCRQKFKIPENGAHGLLNCFFVAELVEARKIASDVVIPVACEECFKTSPQYGTSMSASTMYCVDCNQTLCEKCSRPHKRMEGGPHKVVQIARNVITELTQTQCDKHHTDDARMFCFDCTVNICMACFADEHKQHSCTNIDKVADECAKRVDADSETIKKRVDRARKLLGRLEDEKRKFLAGVEEIGQKIAEMVEELKQQIDKQVNELLLEVQSLQQKTCKEIESRRENIEWMLSDLETFSEQCNGVKCNSDPCDITRAFKDLRAGVTELLRSSDVALVGLESNYSAPTLQFEPNGVFNFLGRPKMSLGVVKYNSKASRCDESPFKFTVSPFGSVSAADFDHSPTLNRLPQSSYNNDKRRQLPHVSVPYRRPTEVMPPAMDDAKQTAKKYSYSTVPVASMPQVPSLMSVVTYAGHQSQPTVPSRMAVNKQPGRQRSLDSMCTMMDVTQRS